MKKGDLTVARQNLDADAVVRLDKETFDGMSTGTVNATTAAFEVISCSRETSGSSFCSSDSSLLLRLRAVDRRDEA